MHRRLIILAPFVLAAAATAQPNGYTCDDFSAIVAAHAPASGAVRLIYQSKGSGSRRAIAIDLQSKAWFLADKDNIQLSTAPGQYATCTISSGEWSPATPAQMGGWGAFLRLFPSTVFAQYTAVGSPCESASASDASAGIQATVRMHWPQASLPDGTQFSSPHPDSLEMDIDPLGRLARIRPVGGEWWVYEYDPTPRGSVWLVKGFGPPESAWTLVADEVSETSKPEWFTREAALAFAKSERIGLATVGLNLLQKNGFAPSPTPTLVPAPPTHVPAHRGLSWLALSAGAACFLFAALVWWRRSRA